ncbi:MAG: sugar nucleotide-binding protein [Spirochaetia bacterium]|nr:sugar nucleotide-binding protein [Spirochaetia bacterium]
MKILIAGASFTGKHLLRYFPEHDVHFLSRNLESPLLPYDSSITYDFLIDTVPAVMVNGAPVLCYKDVFSDVTGRGARIIHISSTSVFPDSFTASRESDLPVFDETSATAPEGDSGRERLALEKLILDTFPGSIILRAGGIYGPGRCVALQIANGDFSRATSGNKMVSRIHVHDLCKLALALGQRSARKMPVPFLVHAVDPNPCVNSQIFEFLEDLLKITIPGNWRSQTVTGRTIRSMYTSDLIEFTYPGFREGFAAVLKESSKVG